MKNIKALFDIGLVIVGALSAQTALADTALFADYSYQGENVTYSYKNGVGPAATVVQSSCQEYLQNLSLLSPKGNGLINTDLQWKCNEENQIQALFRVGKGAPRGTLVTYASASRIESKFCKALSVDVNARLKRSDSGLGNLLLKAKCILPIRDRMSGYSSSVLSLNVKVINPRPVTLLKYTYRGNVVNLGTAYDNSVCTTLVAVAGALKPVRYSSGSASVSCADATSSHFILSLGIDQLTEPGLAYQFDGKTKLATSVCANLVSSVGTVKRMANTVGGVLQISSYCDLLGTGVNEYSQFHVRVQVITPQIPVSLIPLAPPVK